MTPTGIKPVSVLYVILDRIARTESCIEGILSFSNAVPSELVDLLTAIQTYSHFTSFRGAGQLFQQFPGGGLGNKDLTLWSRQIFDYLLLADRLDTYAREFGIGGLPEQPPGLIGGTDHQSDDVPLARQMNGETDEAGAATELR